MAYSRLTYSGPYFVPHFMHRMLRVGALLAATLIPMFARSSLGAVWGALTVLCALALWTGWRAARQIPAPAPVAITPTAATAATSATLPTSLWSTAVVLVFIAYACDAFGFVPHTVFWVDYLDRELQLGAGYASTQWASFGLGAIAGPLCAAYCATRWGWWGTTTGAYLIKAAAIGLPLVWAGFAGHALSGFVVGALSPGMAAITSGYLMQLIGPAQHKKMWGYATAAFALLQATAGYLMAFIYAQTGSYRSLFVLGCAALALGAVMVAFSRSKPVLIKA